jgi:KilA-N domain
MELLTYNGKSIAIHASHRDMLNLTDMWRAAGEPEGREPWRWRETDAAQGFVEAITASLNLAQDVVWKSTRGRHGGGTWAHWQIGFAYAKYLSHEFHAWCNTIVRRHMDQMAKHTQLRRDSIVGRKELMQILSERGLSEGVEFATVTNHTYLGLFRKRAKALRKLLGLRSSQKLRDHLTPLQLSALMLAENMTGERIIALGQHGVDECSASAFECGSFVLNAILAEKRSRQQIAA